MSFKRIKIARNKHFKVPADLRTTLGNLEHSFIQNYCILHSGYCLHYFRHLFYTSRIISTTVEYVHHLYIFIPIYKVCNCGIVGKRKENKGCNCGIVENGMENGIIAEFNYFGCGKILKIRKSVYVNILQFHICFILNRHLPSSNQLIQSFLSHTLHTHDISLVYIISSHCSPLIPLHQLLSFPSFGA